ncbi:39430_t:CDS:10 [Gigaspora margarita]|uniref:39430_t:CDS:1 n=1 Tax=Gigaspora margarita TaxID=4874 RepID=A0ABN7UPY3_GIGMA|nr:39430_t:CDS:10 [Gigaspora margarita]
MTKENIDKEEFNKIKEQALIIDVRDKLEHQDLKSFPNSINVPYKDLIAEPEKYLPDKNKLIIAYCNFGGIDEKDKTKLRPGILQKILEDGKLFNYVSSGAKENDCQFILPNILEDFKKIFVEDLTMSDTIRLGDYGNPEAFKFLQDTISDEVNIIYEPEEYDLTEFEGIDNDILAAANIEVEVEKVNQEEEQQEPQSTNSEAENLSGGETSESERTIVLIGGTDGGKSALANVLAVFLVFKSEREIREKIIPYYNYLKINGMPTEYLTIVRVNFPAFENEEKVNEDREKLQNNKSDKIKEIFSSVDIIYVNNPPLEGSPEIVEVMGKIRKISQQRLFAYLATKNEISPPIILEQPLISLVDEAEKLESRQSLSSPAFLKKLMTEIEENTELATADDELLKRIKQLRLRLVELTHEKDLNDIFHFDLTGKSLIKNDYQPTDSLRFERVDFVGSGEDEDEGKNPESSKAAQNTEKQAKYIREIEKKAAEYPEWDKEISKIIGERGEHDTRKTTEKRIEEAIIEQAIHHNFSSHEKVWRDDLITPQQRREIFYDQRLDSGALIVWGLGMVEGVQNSLSLSGSDKKDEEKKVVAKVVKEETINEFLIEELLTKLAKEENAELRDKIKTQLENLSSEQINWVGKRLRLEDEEIAKLKKAIGLKKELSVLLDEAKRTNDYLELAKIVKEIENQSQEDKNKEATKIAGIERKFLGAKLDNFFQEANKENDYKKLSDYREKIVEFKNADLAIGGSKGKLEVELDKIDTRLKEMENEAARAEKFPPLPKDEKKNEENIKQWRIFQVKYNGEETVKTKLDEIKAQVKEQNDKYQVFEKEINNITICKMISYFRFLDIEGDYIVTALRDGGSDFTILQNDIDKLKNLSQGGGSLLPVEKKFWATTNQKSITARLLELEKKLYLEQNKELNEYEKE